MQPKNSRSEAAAARIIAYLSEFRRSREGAPAAEPLPLPSPPHPTASDTPFAYDRPPLGHGVGRIAPWGTWVNWCPVEGHLWTSIDDQPAQAGDGVVACPDHDGWPNAGTPEEEFEQEWVPPSDDDSDIECRW
jgi:hypothetical protein